MRIGKVIPVLPDEYNTQIGAIIAKWATLEFLMMTIIWRAMGLDNEEGRVLTVGMGTNVLLGILRNLPKRWIADDLTKKEVADLVKAVGESVEARNYLAHGVWTRFEGDPLPYLNFMKQGDHRILPAAQPVSPSQLQSISRVFDDMIILAHQILQRLGPGDVAPPLPDIHGEQNPAGFPNQTQTEK